jgi:SSS family solute:Na+ symporter
MEIYSGAVITRETLGWNLYFSALVILAATGVYTILGGLRAVIYTDFLQSIVFIAGAVVVATLSKFALSCVLFLDDRLLAFSET